MASRLYSAEETDRQADRLTLDASARLRPNAWSSVEVRMVDLSSLGFRAECEARLQPGSCISLDILGVGTVEAQVEWHRGGQFGARFLRPIDVAACGWTLSEHPPALARLLLDRAAAAQAGREGAERQLRRRILAALPVRKGTAAR